MTSETHAAPAPPPTVRAFGGLAVVRVVLVATVQVATVVEVPKSMAGFQARFNARLGLPPPPDVDRVAAAQSVGALFGGLIALAFLTGWAIAAWKARKGTTWAAVVVAVISGLGVFAAVTVPLMNVIGFDLPGWLVALSVAGSAVDVAIVVLLVVPATRAWYRAMTPPPPPRYPPPWAPPGDYPPAVGRRH